MGKLINQKCGEPECCFYHGKLANKLLNEKLLFPEEGLISAGEFVVNNNLQIEKVTNQSGHFWPPGFSNNNFLRLISFKITNEITVKNNVWGFPEVENVVKSRIA